MVEEHGPKQGGLGSLDWGHPQLMKQVRKIHAKEATCNSKFKMHGFPPGPKGCSPKACRL